MLGTCKSPQKSAVWLLLFFILYKMTKLEKLLLDYGFKNLDDLLDCLQNGWRDGKSFENAMECVKEALELFDLYHNERE